MRNWYSISNFLSIVHCYQERPENIFLNWPSIGKDLLRQRRHFAPVTFAKIVPLLWRCATRQRKVSFYCPIFISLEDCDSPALPSSFPLLIRVDLPVAMFRKWIIFSKIGIAVVTRSRSLPGLFGGTNLEPFAAALLRSLRYS